MAKYVDTLDVQLSMRPRAKEAIKSKLYASSDEEGVYKLSPAHLPVAFRYQCRGYYLIVKLSHQFMIGIETAEELQEKVIQLVTNFFYISTDDIVKYKVVKTPTSKLRVRCNSGKEITKILGGKTIHKDLVEINRIEYCNNIKMLNPEVEKLIASDIFRIAPETFNGATKGLYIYPNRVNCTYTTGNNTHVAVTCYFKEYERKEAEDLEGAEKYKSVLRSEIKVKNAHIDYKRKDRDKTLANYFNEEVAQEYFDKYLVPIFFTEDFYRLDVAKDIIQNATGLKRTDGKLATQLDKDRTCSFITEINQFGITAVKKKHDVETFKKYINIVRSLKINPICYSPVIDGQAITVEKIKNFTLFENGIDIDADI